MPRFSPQRTIVIFGSGAQARSYKMTQEIPGEDGEIETEFHLEPTIEMKRYYDLDDKFRNKDGFIVVRYPSKYVIPLNDDPIINTVMVLCDFDYGDTPFTKDYPDPRILKQYMSENRILRGMVAKLEDEKIKALERLDNEMNKDILLIQTARKAGRDLLEAGYVPEERETE